MGVPDGTPNPGFFGANIAAPLLVDLFNALDGNPPAHHEPPPGVSQQRICWPLGNAALAGDDPTCQQRRLAWILDGASPPTFPDRLRGGEARYRILVDPQSGRRALPECFRGPLESREMARWPSVLEPWLSSELRQRVLPPAWLKACADMAEPESTLRIVGASNGDVVRTAGVTPPLLRLEVRGKAEGDVIWLINGQPAGRKPAKAGFEKRMDAPGRYDITVLDDQGRYDRISLSVR